MAELLRLKEEKTAPPGQKPAELEWTSPLSVLKYPDPRLRAKNMAITMFDDRLRTLAAQMFEVMYDDNGVGLAAPQVGVNVRLMVFNERGDRHKGEEVVLVNPQIVGYGEDAVDFEEGCLSFPQLYGDVERPTEVTVRAQDLGGKSFELRLQGWPARIFQHEYDHLQARQLLPNLPRAMQGRLFIDRMTPHAREEIEPGLVELREAFAVAFPDRDPAL